ncbi:MAG TPA: hypothetical protein D7I06_04005 [Candidatus Poseidoniales archaeon]|nr:MAG TPA: hypothetical protein D7I06_04005 [Candidatus Poseidoniales archaeon]HII62753.1 hypothetical protein [Candidatus Poseidoniaceae archaeon]
MGWSQPKENTVPALIEGIQRFDGVELDIRMTSDDKLVLHHDRRPMLLGKSLDGRPEFVENWSLDQLQNEGFDAFSDFMHNPIAQKSLSEESKVVFVELKLPHRRLLKKKDANSHLVKMLTKVQDIAINAGIPKHNLVIYAFHHHMNQVVKSAKYDGLWSQLAPVIPPIDGEFWQKFRTLPSFVKTSFSSLSKKHRHAGSPIVPCALEYLNGWTRHIPIGRSVGLHGASLKRLRQSLNGLGCHVWPCNDKIERQVLRAGLSPISDFANPDQSLPNAARWTKPATMPLEDEDWNNLDEGIKPNSITKWLDLSDKEKIQQLEIWKVRFGWQKNVEEMHLESKGEIPWQAVRLIGHRGCGRSPRYST